MTSRQLYSAVIIPFVAWRVYMRVRRNVGRQLFHPGRLKVSIGIFTAAAVIFLLFTLQYPLVAAALAGGLILAVPIALYGLKLTKFEDTPQGKFYTPNTALGIGISALLVGRLAYRFLVLSDSPGLQAPGTQPMFQSPLTFFLFGLSAGYFIAYQTGVLIRSHKPAPSAGS